MSCSFTGGSLRQEIIKIPLFSCIGDAVEVPERMQPVELVPELNPEKEKCVASRSNCLRSSAPGQARMMKLLKSVNTKGVQGSGLNPSGDILPRSSLFTDFTCEGIGHWILIVSCSFTGGSLKQEIIVIWVLVFVGNAVEVPERMHPVEPVQLLEIFCSRTSKEEEGDDEAQDPHLGHVQGWADESAPESVEDGCLLLGLTQDMIDLN